MVTREEDAVQHLLVANTHDTLLFFTNTGRVLPLRTWQLPAEKSRTARGQPLVNLLPLTDGERITALLPQRQKDEKGFLLFATMLGQVKRTPLAAFANLRSKGLIAMNLKKGDQLIGVRVVTDKDDIILVTEQGISIRFGAGDITAHSRQAGGVRGIRLDTKDHVVALDVVVPSGYLLTVGSLGVGKLTSLAQYRQQGRGGKGIKTLKVTPKTGPVVAAAVVDPDQEVMVVSSKGIMMRTSLEEIRVTGRIAQGVRVMNLEPGDTVASVACFSSNGGPS
jgi:DNA gyrase subunit A